MKNKHPVLRRFMRRKVSVVAAAVLILFVLIAILGPLVWQVDPLKQSVMKKYGPMTVPSIDPRDNRQRILLEGDLPSPIDPPSGCVFHTRCPWATEACKTASCELREVRKGHYAACSRGKQE